MSIVLEKLCQFDTPTVCNAIEVAQGQRGFAAFTRGTVLCSSIVDLPLVGYARTARIAAQKPPDEPARVTRARRLEYFRYMAGGPRPAVAVIEDSDYPDCVGAWWGEVHTAVHKGLELTGAFTNGGMRDLDDLEAGFPVIAGSVGPSHGYCHVQAFGCSVDVFGLRIDEGDLIHADRHGAVVIPPKVVPVLPAAIDKLLATEQLILGPAREEDFDIDKLEAAWARFENERT